MISAVSVRNIGPIEKLDIEDITKAITVGGPNGSGKSFLVDSIAAVISGEGISPSMVHRAPRTGKPAQTSSIAVTFDNGTRVTCTRTKSTTKWLIESGDHAEEYSGTKDATIKTLVQQAAGVSLVSLPNSPRVLIHHQRLSDPPFFLSDPPERRLQLLNALSGSGAMMAAKRDLRLALRDQTTEAAQLEDIVAHDQKCLAEREKALKELRSNTEGFLALVDDIRTWEDTLNRLGTITLPEAPVPVPPLDVRKDAINRLKEIQSALAKFPGSEPQHPSPPPSARHTDKLRSLSKLLSLPVSAPEPPPRYTAEADVERLKAIMQFTHHIREIRDIAHKGKIANSARKKAEADLEQAKASAVTPCASVCPACNCVRVEL